MRDCKADGFEVVREAVEEECGQELEVMFRLLRIMKCRRHILDTNIKVLEAKIVSGGGVL